MFTQGRIGSIVEHLIGGIIGGAIIVGWVLPLFAVTVPIWIGASVGGVLGAIYGAAPKGE
jgi:hypothetical protein